MKRGYNQPFIAAGTFLACAVLAGCGSSAADSSPDYQTQPTPTATSPQEQSKTVQPAPAPPQPGQPAYELPTNWQNVYSTGYGSGESYVEAHYQRGTNAAGQIAVKFYVAKSYSGRALSSFAGEATPITYFGCDQNYLSQIVDGRFDKIIGPADSPACKSPTSPSIANLPQPAEVYSQEVSQKVFPSFPHASD